MRKLLFILLLSLVIVIPSLGQTTSFYTDRALGSNPILAPGQTTPTPIFLSYAPVRVCSLPLTQAAPCLPLATITDTSGNTISNSIGGSFGQILTDVVGRYSFGCTPGNNYQIQVAPSGTLSPSVNYPITCPGLLPGSFLSSLVGPGSITGTFSGNPTMTGIWSFSGPLNATNGGSFGGTFSGNYTGSGNRTDTGTNNHTGAETFANINKTIYVDQQIGTTVDVKAANACALLPAAGGTLDFTGFGGTTQSVAATISCGSSTQPVTFRFDPATLYQPSTAALNMFQFTQGNVFDGLHIDTTNQATYSGNPVQNISGVNITSVTVRNLTVKNASGSTGPCLALTGGSSTTSVVFSYFTNIHCNLGIAAPGLNISVSGGTFINGNTFSGLYITSAKYGVQMLVTDNNVNSQIVGNKFPDFENEAGIASALAAVHMNSAAAASQLTDNDFHFSAFDVQGANNSVLIDAGNICSNWFTGIMNVSTNVSDSTTCNIGNFYDDGNGTFKRAGTAVQLLLGGLIKSSNGSATMGLTLKKGSGAGNYTNATTTYAVADSTNLCFTVTIPTGWKLKVDVAGGLGTSTAVVEADVAITDNAACATANAGILTEAPVFSNAAGNTEPFSLSWVITGDGASHNVALQFKTTNAADTANLLNSSATRLPVMTFTLMLSN